VPFETILGSWLCENVLPCCSQATTSCPTSFSHAEKREFVKKKFRKMNRNVDGWSSANLEVCLFLCLLDIVIFPHLFKRNQSRKRIEKASHTQHTAISRNPTERQAGTYKTTHRSD
jgi:hypothetical protein